MKMIPVELAMDKMCEVCGVHNQVMFAKLDGHPVCERCGNTLTITDEDKIVAGIMYTNALSRGENVDVG